MGLNVSDNPITFTMTCPNCGNLVPPDPIVQNLTICPSCLRSLAIDGTDGVGIRLATAADTTVLSDYDLAAIKKARATFRMAYTSLASTAAAPTVAAATTTITDANVTTPALGKVSQ